MKIIVQIPCYNEEEVLAETVGEIPRSVAGFDSVEILVVDDGSTDRTVEVARAAGVDYIVHHRSNRGLAAAFRSGLDAALRLGADVIVNTDADNQYDASAIPELVQPILEGAADLVVGDRRTAALAHFSWTKRLFQRLGSAAVRRLAGVPVADAVSGFRAISREAAFRMNVVSTFSYTIETLIQAGQARLAVMSVPVSARATARASRLFTSMPRFIERSLTTMARSYTMYHPLRVFLGIGGFFGLTGMVPIARFLYFWLHGQSGGKVQSLVLGGALLTIGFVTVLVGFVADLIAFNRQLVEEILTRLRRIEATQPAPPRDPGDR